jgi:hypothetical protein
LRGSLVCHLNAEEFVMSQATATLVLHCGATQVSRAQLQELRTPPPEGRWHPVGHARVLQVVDTALGEAGYRVLKEQLSVTREGNRFFGVMDLESQLAPGVTLAVGVRNSCDRSFPLGFCAGNRVFCCDNLAFRSELLIRKRHTLNGERNFLAAIGTAVTQLQQFRETEAARIGRLQQLRLTDDQADALLLRSYERGIVGARDLPGVIKEWRTPSFPDFQERTAWALFNAFTFALGLRAETVPTQYAVQTMRLNNLLLPHLEASPAEAIAGAAN